MSESMSGTPQPASSKLRRIGVAALMLVGALVLTGCGERPLSTFNNDSEIASRLSNFLWIVMAIAAIVFVLVQGAVIYMSRRFRVDVDDDDDLYPDDEFPDQVHGNTRLEVMWTIAPTILMAVIGVFTLFLLFDLEEVDARGDNPQIEKVVVVGQQWWWEFQYHLDDDEFPDIVTAGELVLPVGEEVMLEVNSRDVIHSFWVPALNGKRDAMPGRTNTWTIQAGVEGRFPGECTEFCGLSHAYMEKWAIGLSLSDWLEWSAQQQMVAVAPAEGTAAAAGWELFVNNCASCHVINGLTASQAPTTNAAGEAIPYADREPRDSFAIYNGPNRLVPRETLVSGAAPNLTHFASRSTFAGGVYELYEDAETTAYLDLPTWGDLNRGALEAWILNAPELKANKWEDQRGMTPFESLSAADVDNLVEFLTTLEYASTDS